MKWRAFPRAAVMLNRLSREGRSLLAMALASLAVAADVGRTDAHVLVLAILALLGASVLFAGAYRLADVTAELTVPRRVTVGEEIAITLTLRNDGTKTHHAIRVELPRRAAGSRPGAPPLDIDQLAPGQRRSAIVRARFVIRGKHRLGPLRVAALVPLGLAQGRGLATPPAQFAVVPRVARVLSVTTRESRQLPSGGLALATRAADASELRGVRPYRPGDAVRDLHARSWARHGAPMVREYQEASLVHTGVLLDTDVSTTSSAHFEATLSLAAGVVAHLAAGEALVDLLVAGETVEGLSLGRSDGSVELALDALAVVQPGPPFDADRLLARLLPHLERLSSVVFLALADDERRTALARAIEGRGIACSVVRVGDVSLRSAAITTIALAAIEGRRAVRL